MPIEIHGRSYLTVNERMQRLKSDCGRDYSVDTQIVHFEGNRSVVRAVLEIAGGPDGFARRYSGLAEEDRTKGSINRTSALENCETSAIGRALAAAGYGGSEYASANEVQQAIQQTGQQTGPQNGNGHAMASLPTPPSKTSLIESIEKGERLLGRHPAHDSNSRSKHLRTGNLEDADIKALAEYLDHLRREHANRRSHDRETAIIAAELDGEAIHSQYDE